MINLPKFLIIRFAPGAAGNFVSSILQCSKEVAHLSEHQEKLKDKANWIEYFHSVFKSDFSKWLDIEPSAQFNWGTRNIFSQKYNRGNDLTIKEYLNLEEKHCSRHYFESKRLNLFLPIFWHKNPMPAYFKNSSTITINIDKPALRWYDHARYKKHFIVSPNPDGSVTVKHRELRPNYTLPNFNTQYTSLYPNFKQFVQTNITNDEFRNNFLELEHVVPWTIPNITINLSDIISDRFIAVYNNICQDLKITPINSDIVSILHQYWISCHGKINKSFARRDRTF